MGDFTLGNFNKQHTQTLQNKTLPMKILKLPITDNYYINLLLIPSFLLLPYPNYYFSIIKFSIHKTHPPQLNNNSLHLQPLNNKHILQIFFITWDF